LKYFKLFKKKKKKKKKKPSSTQFDPAESFEVVLHYSTGYLLLRKRL